jgi:Protein of unknown function (DUF4231)
MPDSVPGPPRQIRDTRVELLIPQGRGAIRTGRIERTMLARLSWEYCDRVGASDLQKLWLERILAEAFRRRGWEKRNRRVFFLTQSSILSGAVLVPTLITVGTEISWVRYVAIVVSVAVAVASIADLLLRPGPRWRIYRWGADVLSGEIFRFFSELPPYRELAAADRFPLFLERFDLLVVDFHERYRGDIDEALPKERELAPEGDPKGAGQELSAPCSVARRRRTAVRADRAYWNADT